MNRLFVVLCVSAAFVVPTLYIMDKQKPLVIPVPGRTRSWSNRPATTTKANNEAARDGPRSVNLALETSLVFEPKDANNNLKFIAEARKFLDKLEIAISPPKTLRSGDNETHYLTDFLTELAETLMGFDDELLRQFFIILEIEMRLHYYKGSIFREILYDPKLLMYFRNKLKEWASSDPRTMRAKLSMYTHNKDTSMNRLGIFLNDYYKDEQKGKMSEIVEKLRNIYNENEIGAIIRDAVNTLVIQHYDKMNYTARAKLAEEINKLNDLTKIAKSDIDEKLKTSFRKSLKDSDLSDIEHINKLYKKESNKTLVYHKSAELYVKAIDATVVGNSDRDEGKAREKDTISIHKN